MPGQITADQVFGVKIRYDIVHFTPLDLLHFVNPCNLVGVEQLGPLIIKKKKTAAGLPHRSHGCDNHGPVTRSNNSPRVVVKHCSLLDYISHGPLQIGPVSPD